MNSNKGSSLVISLSSRSSTSQAIKSSKTHLVLPNTSLKTSHEYAHLPSPSTLVGICIMVHTDRSSRRRISNSPFCSIHIYILASCPTAFRHCSSHLFSTKNKHISIFVPDWTRRTPLVVLDLEVTPWQTRDKHFCYFYPYP